MPTGPTPLGMGRSHSAMRGAEGEGALAAVDGQMDRQTDVGHLALDEGLTIGTFAQLCESEWEDSPGGCPGGLQGTFRRSGHSAL